MINILNIDCFLFINIIKLLYNYKPVYFKLKILDSIIFIVVIFVHRLTDSKSFFFS